MTGYSTPKVLPPQNPTVKEIRNDGKGPEVNEVYASSIITKSDVNYPQGTRDIYNKTADSKMNGPLQEKLAKFLTEAKEEFKRNQYEEKEDRLDELRLDLNVLKVTMLEQAAKRARLNVKLQKLDISERHSQRELRALEKEIEQLSN